MLPLILLSIFCTTSHAQPDNTLLAAAEQKKTAFVQDLAMLVNIDSGTGNGDGLARIESFLIKKLNELNAKVEVLAAPPSIGNMVIGTLQGSGSKNIMMMIHYDTVYSIGETAKRPFKIENNKAIGPGTADAKGGALIILYALDILRERRFKDYKTLTIFFNPDEETSSLGSRQKIQTIASQQDVVLSYEPPDAEQVIVGTNGIAYVHLTVKGLASHAGSAPEKGHNAALELSHQLLQLNNLGNPEKGTTVNWTVLQAGDRINIIPDKATATADMRMSDLTEIKRVQDAANRIIQKKLIPQTEVTLQVENRRPPFNRQAATEHLATLANNIYQTLGKTLAPVVMRYGTDAGFAYNPTQQTPAVLEGMGIVGHRIHSSDEWADLDSIVPRLYLTVRMLETLGNAGVKF